MNTTPAQKTPVAPEAPLTEPPLPRRRWMRSLIGIAAGSAAAAGTWSAAEAATPGVDLPPEPGPVRELELPAVHEAHLMNGLSLLVAGAAGAGAATKPLPLVSVSLVLRTGSLADPAERSGLADLTATLLAKGALRAGRPVDATTLARQAEALGASLSTSAGADSLVVSMTVMPAKLDAALSLMADVLRRPLLQAAELDRARAQAMDGLRVSLSEPSALASRVARKLWWGSGPHAAVTTPASLQRISRDDLSSFHRRWARPDRAALVLAGDIEPAAARRLADRWLGDWVAPAEPAPELPAVAPAPLALALVLIDLPGAGQSAVVLVAPGVSDDSPERRTAQIANEVLGGGYSSHLNQEIRIRRGLAYGAGSHVDLQRQGGSLVASAQTGNDHAVEVARLLRDTVLAMASEPPPADELRARQSNITGLYSRRFDTVDGTAGLIASRWARGRPLAELRTAVPELLAVTPAAVQGFSHTYWSDAARLRILIVGDLAQAGEGLHTLAPTVLRLKAAELDLDKPLPATPS
jgi:zinc protease